MREITLEAEVRKEVGKHARALRRNGMVPGIFYVHGQDNIPVTVSEKSLKPLIFTSETHIINLKVDGSDGRNCILRDIQFDPVSDRPIHFDLQGLLEDEEITVEVPIVLAGGTPQGVRDGGVLQQIVHRLRVSCLPKYIPEHIEVNVADLKINQFVHVRDLKIENVTILENENSSLVGVVPPTVEKEPVAGTPVAEEAVEPEVIGKGKKPEEGEAEEGAAGAKPEVGATPKTQAKEEKEKK
jgi:large subunit ribosomal protein L25